jgi:hypothetical protein
VVDTFVNSTYFTRHSIYFFLLPFFLDEVDVLSLGADGDADEGDLILIPLVFVVPVPVPVFCELAIFVANAFSICLPWW